MCDMPHTYTRTCIYTHVLLPLRGGGGARKRRMTTSVKTYMCDQEFIGVSVCVAPPPPSAPPHTHTLVVHYQASCQVPTRKRACIESPTPGVRLFDSSSATIRHTAVAHTGNPSTPHPGICMANQPTPHAYMLQHPTTVINITGFAIFTDGIRVPRDMNDMTGGVLSCWCLTLGYTQKVACVSRDLIGGVPHSSGVKSTNFAYLFLHACCRSRLSSPTQRCVFTSLGTSMQ
jgi:hypothetical protein